jgi:glycosyltransferase involved in cell wall biosynthesis
MLIHGAADNDLHPPRIGGTQRTFGLYRGLARRHDVRVLCMVENRNRSPRDERVHGVTLARRRAWYTSAAWRLERARLAPLWLAALGHRARAARLAAALPGEPDVRAADFNLAGLLAAPGGALRVYLSQNVEYDFFLASAPRLAARGWWARRVRAFEADAASRADLVVAVSDEDAARFRALYGVRDEALAVIPNGWDETAVRPAGPERRRAAREALGLAPRDYALLFVGSDFAHNREALRWIVEVLMPAVAPGGAKLLVAGSVTRVVAGRREPWLVAAGAVPDLTGVLDAADAGLNPVETGGGSNVKLPTYLGAGLAALTTRFGLRGYAELAAHAVVAPRDGFADAVAARPRGWAAEGAAAPPAVAAFAWGALGGRLGDRLEACLAARDAARGAAGTIAAAAVGPPVAARGGAR